MGKIKWPESVPVLAPSDMHHGQLRGEQNRAGDVTFCLVGRTRAVFEETESHFSVYKAIETAAWETNPKKCGRFLVDGRLKIADYNDMYSKLNNSRIWNRAMAILGYVTGNPEARWWAGILRKRKPKK